jgi:FkbM family methyltransferase
VKELIRRIILAAGYEIRHKDTATTDPFRQQGIFLRGVSAPVIFDVGANVGTTSEKYRHLFPGAKIFAFEPFSDAFEQLEQRVRGDSQIVHCKFALGNVRARKELRVNVGSPTNSLLETAESAATFWGKGLLETNSLVQVEVETVDDFCRQEGISNIDVLKIDTQGTENEVLKGASEMLSQKRIRLIYTEMIVVPTYKGQSRPHELMSHLEGFGYALAGLYDLWRRTDGRLLQMDAIFVRD